jgi:hypothetical protein
MPSAPKSPFEDEIWEMESDFPSLANQAAIELDNYRLKKSAGFEAVRRLSAKLASDLAADEGPASAGGQYDPITIGIISRAIDELVSDPGERPTQVKEVAQYATRLAEQLRQAADNPESLSQENLADLRDKCLVLSESAAEHEWPPDENDPRHRFRR